MIVFIGCILACSLKNNFMYYYVRQSMTLVVVSTLLAIQHHGKTHIVQCTCVDAKITPNLNICTNMELELKLVIIIYTLGIFLSSQ